MNTSHTEIRSIVDADENYPRPQLRRDSWTNLNGEWQFAIDKDALFALRDMDRDAAYPSCILVPFAPETPASLVADTGFYKAVWYRKHFEAPRLRNGERLWLHFGAVDWSCDVYLNGKLATHHEGGYTPFSVDVTDLLKSRGVQSLVVRAHDDPHDMAKPRGKQDWRLEAHSIWYPRTTGIWQTVWMEVQPPIAISHLTWSSDVTTWSIGLTAEIAGLHAPAGANLALRVRLSMGDRILSDDSYAIVGDTNAGAQVSRRIELDDPGIGDERFALLWSPEHPHLITAQVTLVQTTGSGNKSRVKVIDSVLSYTAMRSVAVDRTCFLLNDAPYHLALVLDQGYWSETGLTAPDCAALRRDVELTKQMGFNGVRKHQKIEDPRYLFIADKLGLMVWEEMPSPYAFNALAQKRLIATWGEALRRDLSHPCIVAWVPYNESWGLPNLTDSAAQRDSQRALYYLTRSLDPSRPVIGNDGWEMCAGDIIAVHDYDGDNDRLKARYHSAHNDVSARCELFASEKPGGRRLILDQYAHSDKPVMLTEFGGICYARDEQAWGYKRCSTVEALTTAYADCLRAVRQTRLFAGFCYTQLTDTYQEANGLLYMDRTPKFDVEEIARLTRG